MTELFVNPWLLGGLALAAAPLVIHLLNKRRYRVHDWAAMDFLFAAMVENRRRLKFEDLLLLLLRIAVIALLVFTVARPIVQGLAGWREDERVVVLDDSFSMEVVGPTGPVFELAKEAALQQVQDAVGGGIPVGLWLGTDPLAAAGEIESRVEGGVVADADAESEEDLVESAAAGSDSKLRSALAGKRLLDALRRAETCDLPLRFADIVRRVVDEAADEKAPRLRSVVLVSDLRAVDWVGEDGALRDALRAAFEEVERQGLAERLRFQFVDVGLESADNLALTKVEVEDSPVLAGVPARIAVEVTNFGREPAAGVAGELEVHEPQASGTRPAHAIPLPTLDAIAPGETARVEVEHAFEAGGEYLVRARVESVRLARDDESYCVAVVRDALRALVVDGDPDPDRFASESGLLVAALQPRGEAPSGVETHRIEGALSARDLESADLVFILNRGELSAAERDVLEDFAAAGGGVAWFLGDQVRPESYRELAEGAASEPSRRVLFPASLTELRDARAGAEAAHVRFDDFEHPTLSLFRGVQNPAFEHVVFRRFVHLYPLPGARVLAHFDDPEATPAVVEGLAVAKAAENSSGDAPSGGRVVVFNTTADRDWSDWPTDYTYPVLLQEWARHLSRPAGAGRVLELGEAIRADAAPGVEVAIESAAGEKLAVDEDQRFAPRRAGFYRLTSAPREGAAAASAATARWYAFRRPAAESDLEALGEARLRAALEPLGVEFTIGSEVDVDAFRRQQEGEVWRWLALAAGLFLVVELFAAWWFGRRT